MDIKMADMNGISATEAIKAEFPETAVLALTMYEDDQYFFEMLKAGASGYVLKGAGLVSSTSEAFRMLKQGAVKIDGEKVEDRGLQIKAGSTHIYQVGKRKFARVTLA